MASGNHDTLVYRLAQILVKFNQGEKLDPHSLATECGVNLRTVEATLVAEDGIWLRQDNMEVVLKIASDVAGYFKRRHLIANQVIERNRRMAASGSPQELTDLETLIMNQRLEGFANGPVYARYATDSRWRCEFPDAMPILWTRTARNPWRSAGLRQRVWQCLPGTVRSMWKK